MLFPTPAGAVFASMGASDVSAIETDGDLQVRFHLNIPDGEHFPVDEIEVRAVRGAIDLDANGRIILGGGSWPCGGPISTADAGIHVVLVSVAGGQTSQGPFGGQGYTSVGYDVGTGYFSHSGYQNLGGLSSYDNGYGAGTGLGYGYGSAGMNLEITVRLVGCTFFTGALDDFSAPFTFQAIVGAGGLGIGASTLTLPVTKTLVNPLAAEVIDPTNAFTTVVTTTTSGSQTSSTATISGAGGNTALDATLVSDFQELNPGNPSLGLPGVTSVRASFNNGFNGGTIPAGTEVGITHQTGASASLGAPAFGISGVALGAATNSNPLTYFRITSSAPGLGDFNPGDLLETLEIRLCFAAASIPNANLVQMRGFDDTGSLKSGQPSLQQRVYEPGPDRHCFIFEIRDFSAFAVIIATSGGGGGPMPTTTTTQAPTADIDADGLPDTWELQYFGSKTGADPTGDADDDGLTNVQEFLAGTDPTKADTDGDGISDVDEIAQGTDPKDPNSPDASTSSQTGTGTDDATSTPKDGDNNRIPGFGVFAILAGLGAAALLVRRRL